MSKICDFYNGKNIFITGGTGFLGKVLIEKLLRCTNVNKIFVLIRMKRNKSIEERLDDLIDSPLFEKTKHLKTKIVPIFGSIEFPNFSLRKADEEELLREVNIVFNCAANVHLAESIKTAFSSNVKSTSTLLHLCEKMQNLVVAMHVSTAFSHCQRNKQPINEVFYSCPNPQIVEKAMESASEDKILGDWPNTYTFTKALAEDIVKENNKVLVGVFRPAIVCQTSNEPLANWCDSSGGANIFLIGAATGLTRMVPCNNSVMEMVPVDLTISALIAAAWDVAMEKTSKIYNFVSSIDNPITYEEFLILNNVQLKGKANKMTMISDKSLVFFLMSLYDLFIALFLDAFQIVQMKRPMFVKQVQKLHEIYKSLSYFSCRSWNFSNDNVKKMWTKMNETDQNMFNFDIAKVQWLPYLRGYVSGLKVYVLKAYNRRIC